MSTRPDVLLEPDVLEAVGVEQIFEQAGFLGFEVADLKTGQILHHVEVPGVTAGRSPTHGIPSHGIAMTQERIANLLGVRREGVTEAAGKLQAEGLISYSRGHITVLDRARLEEEACECYAVVKKEFDRLLPYVAR